MTKYRMEFSLGPSQKIIVDLLSEATFEENRPLLASMADGVRAAGGEAELTTIREQKGPFVS